MCVCVFIYLSISVFIESNKEKNEKCTIMEKKEIDIDRHTDIQTDRQIITTHLLEKKCATIEPNVV